ncbi:MAG: response regulator [bacterium]
MKKILIADDDPTVRMFYRDILSEAGFEVSLAEDAAAALTRYQEVQPDLVVLDVNMPAGGGLSVYRRFRDTLAVAVPVIFITGNSDKVNGLAGIPGVAVMKKPVAPDVLISQIERILMSNE